jgi:hypothetical protein
MNPRKLKNKYSESLPRTSLATPYQQLARPLAFRVRVAFSRQASLYCLFEKCFLSGTLYFSLYFIALCGVFGYF